MEIITIGRSKGSNTICISDSKVSRHHLQTIRHDNGTYSISDFGSSNGTYVNEIRVKGELTLKPFDVIRIGKTTLPWLTYFNESDNKHRPNNNISNFFNNFSFKLDKEGKIKAGIGFIASVSGILSLIPISIVLWQYIMIQIRWKI